MVEMEVGVHHGNDVRGGYGVVREHLGQGPVHRVEPSVHVPVAHSHPGIEQDDALGMHDGEAEDWSPLARLGMALGERDGSEVKREDIHHASVGSARRPIGRMRRTS